MNNLLRIGLLAFGSLVNALTACRHETPDYIIPSCNLPETVSFQQHIIPLFEAHCSISDCHSGEEPEGNLNLETEVAYENLMDESAGYIDTLQPTFSVLYASIISLSDPMPPDGRLDSCQLELVKKWIEQKAKNN